MSSTSLPHYRPLSGRNVVPLSLALASALALAPPPSPSRATTPHAATRPSVSQAAPAAKPATAGAAASKPAATRTSPPTPAQPKPATVRPTGAQQASTRPAAATAASTKPASANPASAKPASTKPAATQPSSTRPTSAKPAAPRPAAGKPAATRAATAPTVLPALKPGQFVWMPELAPQGPVVAVVSLPEQRVHVYRNGVRIGVSTISSGRRGFETITGTFPILERQTEHYSNIYDNAPMPFMLRLTWSGTALHAGRLPGYPASHGCVRLPQAFAQSLFDSVRRGTVVVIADNRSHPARVVSPGWITPVDPATGAVLDDTDATLAEFWAPERAPEGPVTLLLGTRDHRLIVLRNGIVIGRADATITGEPPPGTRLHALRIEAIATAETDDPRIVATATTTPPPPVPTLRWQAIAQPGKPPATGTPLPLLRGGELRLSESFARSLQAALPAESSIVITDDPLRPLSTDPLPAPPADPARPPADPPAGGGPPAGPTPAPTPLEPPAPLPAPPETATPVTPPTPTPAQTPQPGR